MNTEIILYKQQLAANPDFNITPDYGWSYTGSGGVDWDVLKQKITKIAGVSRILYQSDLLVEGVQYRFRVNVSGRTAGSAAFKCSVGGSNIASIGVNGIFDYTFIADGTDIVFDTTSAFDGSFSKFSITEYPEAYSLDLVDDIGVPLNFNIDDIFDLSKRKTTFSKTVKIPGTHNNNIAFDKVYKINSEDLFIPTKLSRVIILNSGIQIFDGSLSLDLITKNISDGIERITYSVTMFGELVSILDKLGESTIKDLDFARWDHAFDDISVFRSSGVSDLVEALPQIYDNSVAGYIDSQTILLTKNATSISSATYKGNSCVQINFATPHSFAIGDDLCIRTENNLLSGTHVCVDVPSANALIIAMKYSNLTSTTFTNCKVEKREWHGEGYYYPMQDNGSWMKECVNGDVDTNYGSITGQLVVGRLYTVISLYGDDFTGMGLDPVTLTAMTITEGCTFVAESVPPGDPYGTPVTVPNWTQGSVLRRQIPQTQQDAKLQNKTYNANHWYLQDFIPHIFVNEVWDKMFQFINYYFVPSVWYCYFCHRFLSVNSAFA